MESRTEEIRQKNRQILELDSLKTRFFNNISHEFRTLVTMVKAPAETLMEEEKVSHKGQRSLEVIYRNANKLMQLVTQLLDISRVDKGSMKLTLCRRTSLILPTQWLSHLLPWQKSKGSITATTCQEPTRWSE